MKVKIQSEYIKDTNSYYAKVYKWSGFLWMHLNAGYGRGITRIDAEKEAIRKLKEDMSKDDTIQKRTITI